MIPSSWRSRVLSLLRIVAAFSFATHGAQKLFAFPVSAPQAPAHTLTLTWFAGICEFFGGTLVLVGLFTRPVAFILAGEMAVAYFTQHAPGGFWPILNRGELATVYCLVWLYLAAAGPGDWSLDAWLAGRRASALRVASRSGVGAG